MPIGHSANRMAGSRRWRTCTNSVQSPRGMSLTLTTQTLTWSDLKLHYQRLDNAALMDLLSDCTGWMPATGPFSLPGFGRQRRAGVKSRAGDPAEGATPCPLYPAWPAYDSARPGRRVRAQPAAMCSRTSTG